MSDSRPSLQKAIAELTDGTRSPSRRLLPEFSDLDQTSLEVIFAAWPQVQLERKRLLLDGLRDLSDENTLVSFEDFARRLLADPEGQVRTRAIRLLDESRDLKLVPAYIRILADDADAETRAAAASALGQFVELGELEEIPAEVLPACARRQVVYLLPRVLSDVTDPQIAVLAVEGETPGIAHAHDPDLGTVSGLPDERVV